MKITIMRPGPGVGEVFFASEYGEGRGRWHGPPAVPGTVLEAEMELTELLTRWADILPAESGDPGIRIEGGKVLVTGILDNIESDGTGILLLGGEEVPFESLGEPMVLGAMVTITAGELQLYPALNGLTARGGEGEKR